jgi:glycosyltransferase involved in cell wall biosynthesis
MHIISGDLWAGAESQAFTLLKHLHTNVSLHVVIMNDGELFRRLEAVKIPVTLIPEIQLSSAQVLKRLIKIVHTFNPDVLHTHRQKENILGNLANLLAAIPFKKRAPSVRTAHGAPEFAPKGKQKIQVWLDNWVGKYLQQSVIAVSNELANKLGKIFSPDKIHVIHNGVDTAALHTEKKIADFRQQAPHSLHIGIIGRVEPVKRVDIFIDMANLLLKDNNPSRPMKFHIIGNGSLRSEMEEKINQLELGDQIHFHGHRTDMAACIASLDAIVMCSDHEGTPMTALEALALSTPLIAHKTGGLIDVLKDFPSLLVSNHSGEGYAEAVRNNILLESTFEIKLNPSYDAIKNKEDTLNLYKSLVA